MLSDDLAEDLADRALKSAHARLAGVIADDVADGVFGNLGLVLLEAVQLLLLGDEVLHGDVHLFILGVAREADHFHTVKKRRRNVVRVARCNEHHVREIEVDVDVVVLERAVLFGVEHFKKRRRRIAAVVGAELVDFVKQKERIAHPDLRDRLQDLARHRADVGAAMAADLAFVVHAAQGHAHELAARGARNRLAQTRLAHARGAHKAQNGRLHLVDAALHREVLKDALLHLLKAPVILVEDFGRLVQIGRHFGLLLPRELKERIEVAADDGRLGAHGLHHAKLLQLGLRLLLGLLAHAGGGNAVAVDVEVVAGRGLLTSELLLDGLHLLVEVVVALALLHLLLDAALDALFNGEDVHFARKEREQVVQALLHVGLLKELLLAVDRKRQVAGDRIGEFACSRHAVDRIDDIFGELLALAGVVVEAL